MKENVANMLCQFGDLELHEDYSGRGMYGKTTFAVSGEPYEFWSAIAEFVEHIRDGGDITLEDQETNDDFVSMIRNIKTDSLGMGTIFY